MQFKLFIAKTKSTYQHRKTFKSFTIIADRITIDLYTKRIIDEQHYKTNDNQISGRRERMSCSCYLQDGKETVFDDKHMKYYQW